jgi:acyl-homoserine-lactone acylase
MKKLVLAAAMALAASASASGQAPATDAARWEQQAHDVTIIRDDWGIAHVYGKTDAV